MLLHQRFISTAKKFSNKLAFNDCSTDRKITYGKALIASLLLADEFDKYEQGFIGIMIPTSAGCGLATLGILMSGRTPVMINYSIEAAKNVRYAQKKCNFKTVITSRKLLEKINCPHVEGMVYLEDMMESLTKFKKIKAALKSKLPMSILYNLVHKGKEDDNVAIIFTSGSEKDPKAVPLTHRNLVSNIRNLTIPYQLSEKDIVLANLPYFHTFGLLCQLWVPFYHGMTMVTYANPRDYKAICDILRKEKPTFMHSTPSFFRGYLRKSEPGDFSSLRYAVCGGDKCPDALRQGFIDKHNLVLYEAYGSTETTCAVSGNYDGFNKPGSIGPLFPGNEVRIEHYETGDECKTGEAGKILVKGDHVMGGYLGDIEETSRCIRGGWYDTGDMGYLDEDGYLWHSGRLKRFVKVGGEMISLVKVEDILEKYLPKDVECCVIDVPDPVKVSKVIAVVTKAIDQDAILKKMAVELPNISLPRQFEIMEELPKMGSGKIDFRTITDMVQETMGAQ